MSPREVIACYRLYAAYCLEIAQEFDEPGRKIALLNMAQTWIALADWVEKAGADSLGSRFALVILNRRAYPTIYSPSHSSAAETQD